MRLGVSRIVGSLSVLVVVGAVWAGARPPAAPPAPSELLYLQTRHGITALDTRNGSTAYTAPGATAAGNWSRLFVTSPVGGRSTLVSRLDPATGRTAETVQLVGRYAVKIVSRATATPPCSCRSRRARPTRRSARRRLRTGPRAGRRPSSSWSASTAARRST